MDLLPGIVAGKGNEKRLFMPNCALIAAQYAAKVRTSLRQLIAKRKVS
ncbi:hypothetical protein USDA257_c25320 [Sinorhizobium fredii USDA 257]|uniref:Uncharacterized protein n=1 Tax=Sinorhizobium fredii (strain USDA 257) TaxID=1185652 RepID=I3X5F2_SINF2|nr:hypothetical protein USDA257_c25320 [Sinorhizobium fredii USDA 257]